MSNVLNGSNLPQVISISYGSPEASINEAERLSIELLYMQAAAQGISVFVSGGDYGPDENHAD